MNDNFTAEAVQYPPLATATLTLSDATGTVKATEHVTQWGNDMRVVCAMDDLHDRCISSFKGNGPLSLELRIVIPVQGKRFACLATARRIAEVIALIHKDTDGHLPVGHPQSPYGRRGR